MEIEVQYHSESKSIAGYTFSTLKDRILETQSIQVDTISGATFTSRGFLTAIKRALQSESLTDSKDDASLYPDGIYRGRGEGARGMISLRLLVEKGQLRDIEILSHSDSPSIAELAFLLTHFLCYGNPEPKGG